MYLIIPRAQRSVTFHDTATEIDSLPRISAILVNK